MKKQVNGLDHKKLENEFAVKMENKNDEFAVKCNNKIDDFDVKE